MPEQNFDLIVIGAGPAGYVAAIRAAQLGMRVACVEKDATLGGTCLNVGCIPSKALLDSSELYHQASKQFARHGILLDQLRLDLPAMMARKDGVVQANTRGIDGLFRKHKIERIRGMARLAAPGKVTTTHDGATRDLTARNILIATGSAPISLRTLPFDGKRVVSSTEALTLNAVPRKLAVIGAGAIGLELGSVWLRLGAEVAVYEFLDRIVPLMDREMTGQLQRSLEKQGMTFHLQTTAESAKVVGEQVELTLSGAGGARQTQAFDRVLVAVGRKPFTEGLGLAELGVKLDAKGFVMVNEHYETSVGGVYAVGDVIGGAMLAHKAEEEGIAAIEGMAGHAGHVNYLAVPSVVYTFPELSSVGLTEEEAKAKYGPEGVRIGKFPFTASGRARALDTTEGLVKVIGHAETDRLLGVHMLGPRTSDLIAEATVAIEFAASVEDIARSIHAHPTLPEAFKEAALAVDRRAIHI